METPAYLTALRAYYKLHPVFEYIQPTEQVLLEHPHIAETDPTRLAYTRNPKDGEDFLVNGHKRQTITSVTKYLKRHYPDIKDSDIFKLSHQHEEFLFLTDIKQIIHAVETGPSSCMKSTQSACAHNFDRTQHRIMLQWLVDPTLEEPEWDLHPYSVYSLPGWKLAIHKGPSPVDRQHAIVGRALVYEKTFVRSFYQAKDPTGYSQADIALENWLESQGIEKEGGWPEDTPIALLDGDDGPLLPYIDGDNCHVNVSNDRCFIVEEGEYKCDNANGTGELVEEEVAVGSCRDCECDIYDGEDCILERDDRCVCGSCMCRYSFARAFVHGRFRSWHVKEDEAVIVDGDLWDVENLPNSFVRLEDGDYADIEGTCEVAGEYYLITDDRVCQVGDTWYLSVDCWQDVDGDWHCDEEECVVVDDGKYLKGDRRIVKTVEGGWCLTTESWVDGEGGMHHNSVESHELDGELWTTEQRDKFVNLYQLQLVLV